MNLRESVPLAARASILAAAGISSALIGTIWWTIAFRAADPAEAGLYVSALATAMLAAELGSLGVGYGLIRYLVSGGLSRRFVSQAFGVVIAASTAGAFLLTFILYGLDVPALGNGLFPDAVVTAVVALTVSTFALSDNLLLAVGQEGLILARAGATGMLRVAVLLGLVMIANLTAEMLLVSFAVPGIATTLWVWVKARREHKDNQQADVVGIRPFARYASQSYVASVAAMTLDRLLPLFVLAYVGPTAVARFGVAWVIAGLMALLPYAVAQTTFARNARSAASTEHGVVPGIVLVLVVQVPATAAILFAAPLVLPLLGSAYAATNDVLPSLLAGVLMVGISSQIHSRLRVLRDGLRVVIATQVIQLLVVVALASALLPAYGLQGIGLAWLAGTSVALALGALGYRAASAKPRVDQN